MKMCHNGCRYQSGPEGDCGLSSRDLKEGKREVMLCMEVPEEPKSVDPTKKALAEALKATDNCAGLGDGCEAVCSRRTAMCPTKMRIEALRLYESEGEK
jgi:hypothetical protein